MLAQQRKARLIDAMSEAGLDLLVVYGNAWQNDYLRYATDFGILEGQALALVRNDGQVTLYLDSPLEVDRAQIDCPGLEVIHAPDLVGEVDGVLDRFRNQRIGAGPHRLIPRRIAARAEGLKLRDETALMDRLRMAKLDAEIGAIRRAARLAVTGYAVFRDAARPGRADYELIAEIEALPECLGGDLQSLRGFTKWLGRLLDDVELVPGRSRGGDFHAGLPEKDCRPSARRHAPRDSRLP
jgi:Xaa-Pro aminopeptidase